MYYRSDGKNFFSGAGGDGDEPMMGWVGRNLSRHLLGQNRT